MLKTIFSSRTQILYCVVIISLVVCNILIIKQNLDLRTEIKTLAREQRIQVGEDLSALKAVDLENNSVAISTLNDTKTVIMLSSTTCPYCKEQNTYWIDSLKQLDPNRYQMIALFNIKEEKGQVVEYLKDHGYSSEMLPLKILFLSDENLQKYKLRGIPTTVVLNGNGKVEKVWLGLWDRNKISEANSFFGIFVAEKQKTKSS